MLVIPTWVAGNSYVPPPWAVSYSIIGLGLHSKTPSYPHQSVTFSGHFHHGWLLGTSVTSLIRTPTPQKRVNYQKCLQEVVVFLVFYTTYYLDQHTENVCFSAQVHNQSCHHFLPSLWEHILPSPSSTLQHYMLWVRPSLPLSFCGDILTP